MLPQGRSTTQGCVPNLTRASSVERGAHGAWLFVLGSKNRGERPAYTDREPLVRGQVRKRQVHFTLIRNNRLRESSGAEGGACIHANARWTKRLHANLAAMRLCDRRPAAVASATTAAMTSWREEGLDAMAST